jgi:hypothetical protein
MCFNPLRYVGTETQVMLLAVITASEVHEVDRPDDVSVAAMIEEAHKVCIPSWKRHTPYSGSNPVYGRNDVLKTAGLLLCRIGINPEILRALHRNSFGFEPELFR